MDHQVQQTTLDVPQVLMATQKSVADALARIIDLFHHRSFSQRGIVNIQSLNAALGNASNDKPSAADAVPSNAAPINAAPDLIVQVQARSMEEYPPSRPIIGTVTLSFEEIRGAIAKSSLNLQDNLSSTELYAWIVNSFLQLSDQNIWDIELIGKGDNDTTRTMQLLPAQSAVQYIMDRILPIADAEWATAIRFDRMLRGRMGNFGCILDQSCYQFRDQDGACSLLHAELICLLALLKGKMEYSKDHMELQRHAFVLTITQGMQVRTASASLQTDQTGLHTVKIELGPVFKFPASFPNNQQLKEEVKEECMHLLATLLSATQTGAHPDIGCMALQDTELPVTALDGSGTDDSSVDSSAETSGVEGRRVGNATMEGSPDHSPWAVLEQVAKQRVTSGESDSSTNSGSAASTYTDGGQVPGTSTATTTPMPSPIKGPQTEPDSSSP